MRASDMRWMSRRRSRSMLVGIAAMSILFFAACGGDRNVGVGDDGGGGGGGGGGGDDANHRYAQIDDLDLATGEAKQGLHLRPGIEILRVNASSTEYQVDIDDDAMTVTLVGEARDQALDVDEIWTDDILMGDDFIFLIVDVIEEGAKLIFEVDPFELYRVVHGDWNIDMAPLPEGYMNLNLGEADPNMELSLSIKDLFDKAWKHADISGSGAGTVTPTVDGSIEFPMDWEGQFEGRISAAGRGVNPDYECEPVERVKRRLWGGSRVVKEEPRYFCMEYLLLKGVVGIDLETYANFDAEAEFKAEATHTRKLPRPLGPAPIGTTPLGIYLEPYLKFGIEAVLEMAGELNVDAKGSLRVPLGFEYIHNDGISMLPNDNHPVQIGQDNTIDPELSDELKASLKLYGQAGMNLILADMVTGTSGPRMMGPQAGIEVGKEIEGQNTPELCVKGAFYFRAFVNPRIRAEFKAWRIGVGIDILDPDDLSYRHNFFKYSFPQAPEGTDYEDMCDVVEPDPESPAELINRLTWSEPTELDLVLVTPNGNTFRYDATNHDGGVYDPVHLTDSCLQDNSQCEEVIYWDEDYLGYAPPAGEYQVYVDNWQSSGETANYQLEVIADGEVLPVSYSGQVAPGQTSSPVSYTIRP